MVVRFPNSLPTIFVFVSLFYSRAQSTRTALSVVDCGQLPPHAACYHQPLYDIYIEEIYKLEMNFSGIGGLRRIKPFVSQGSLVALDRSLIQPYFDYCSLLDTCDKIDKR